MNALAVIHVGKKQLGLDDDTYRDLLERETGQRSAKGLSAAQVDKVLVAMRRAGFRSVSSSPGKAPASSLSGPYAKKAQALWIALWNLGAVEDRKDSALLAFVDRQTGIQRTEWLRDPDQGKAVIEALKSWTAREGVVWTNARRGGVAGRYGFQIAIAQFQKLTGAPHISAAFWAAVSDVLSRSISVETPPDDREWQTVMNAFGKRLRARKVS